jgi:hypothetical protein
VGSKIDMGDGGVEGNGSMRRRSVILPSWFSETTNSEFSYVDRRCIWHSCKSEDGIKAECFYWSCLCKGPNMSEVVAKGEIRRHQLQ